MSIENEIKDLMLEVKQRTQTLEKDVQFLQNRLPSPISTTKNEATPQLLTKSHKVNSNHDQLDFGKTLKGIVTGTWDGSEQEYKALGSPNASGGYMLPLSIAAEVVDLARAKSVCVDAGVRTIILDPGTSRIPVVLTDPTATWKAENAALTATDITFGSIDFVPKTLAATVRCSIELFEDSRMVNEVIVQTLMKSLGAQLDYACLRGDGLANNPTGIRHTSNVVLIDAAAGAGAVISRELIADACKSIWANNGNPNAVVFNTRDFAVIDQMKDTTNQPMRGFPSYESLRKLQTSAIPTNILALTGGGENTSEVFVGDFSQLVIGTRTNWTVEASRVAGDAFEKMQVAIRIYGRYDVAVLQPKHFAVIKNIKA